MLDFLKISRERLRELIPKESDYVVGAGYAKPEEIFEIKEGRQFGRHYVRITPSSVGQLYVAGELLVTQEVLDDLIRSLLVYRKISR